MFGPVKPRAAIPMGGGMGGFARPVNPRPLPATFGGRMAPQARPAPPSGGLAARVGGAMGGRGAPGAGPTSGLAGRVRGAMGGGAPPGAMVQRMPGDMRDKLRGGAGLAQRDFETYQGGMTPRAASRDFAAFQSADRAASAAPPGGGFSERLKGMLGGLSGQPASAAGPGAALGSQNLAQRASGAGLALLSDRESKARIRELESELDRTYEALEGTRAEYPETGAPDNLDEAFTRPTSNEYEYRNPRAPGAAPGRQVGPMADELRGIPGVVSRGADGMDRVDAPRLTMANTSQIANLTRGKADRREIDQLQEQLDALGDNPDAVLDRAAGRGGARR
jgi:hypothetical protein